MTRLQIAVVLLAHLTDLVTFWWGTGILGLGAEMNPLSRGLVERGGYGLDALVKVGGVLLGLAAIYVFARMVRSSRLVWAEIGLLASFGGVGALANVGAVWGWR